MADPATDAMAAESPMTADPTLRALSTPRPDTSRDDALIRDVKESQDRSRQIFAQGQQDIAPFRSQALKQLGSPHPAPPQFERVPQMETKQGGSAIEAWMTALIPLAALAAAHGRNSSTNALAAMTGGLDGIKAGNREVFEQNFKVLKSNQEAIVQNNTQLQQQYMDILNDRKLSTQEMMSAVQLVAGANQDQLAMEAATRGDTIQLAQLIDKRDQLTSQLQERANRWISHVDDLQERSRHNRAMEGVSQERVDQSGRRLDQGTISPEAMTELVRRYKEIGPAALQGHAITALNKPAFEAELARQGVTGEGIRRAMAETAGEVSGGRAIGTRAAYLDLASNEAKELIPRVEELIDKVDRTKNPTLNHLISAWQKGTGNENEIRLGIAIPSLVTVYARVLKPTGQITEGDTKRAEDILNRYWASGQMKAALDQAKKEIASAQRGLARAQGKTVPPLDSGGPKEDPLGIR